MKNCGVVVPLRLDTDTQNREPLGAIVPMLIVANGYRSKVRTLDEQKNLGKTAQGCNQPAHREGGSSARFT